MAYAAAFAVSLALIAAAPVSSASASPVQEMHRLTTLMSRLDAAIQDRDSDGIRVAREAGLDMILGELPPQQRRAPPRPDDGILDVQTLDVRLALAMLAQGYGATLNQAVLEAQSQPDHKALVIRSGAATLSDVALFLRNLRLQDASAGNALKLRVPLVVWEGAELLLEPGEELILSRSDGAFLLNFGVLRVNGATIRGTEEPNPAKESYRPFVTTAGGGTMIATGARFMHLGFGKLEKFAGVSIIRNGMLATTGTPVLTDNYFEDLMSVHVSNVSDMTIRNNRFHETNQGSLVAVRARHLKVLGNVFTGQSLTNAMQILHGSTDALIQGNLVLGGQRGGIVVKFQSHRAQILNNVVWRRTGSGIIYAKSDCGRIQGNLVLQNRQKGIEVRSSRETWVDRNLAAGSRNAGIWISAQQKDARTFVTGNRLVQNRVGLATATGGQVILKDNDFAGQLPRMVAGDISFQGSAVAADVKGRIPVVLTAAGAFKPDAVEPGICPR